MPELGKIAPLVCIPTTSGTGSEVTPFAVVTDESTGQKYPLADYALTPTMASVDTHLVRLGGCAVQNLSCFFTCRVVVNWPRPSWAPT